MCGTSEYMAPEIFLSQKQCKKTDVWALGILLYELYHGKAPFVGQKLELIKQQLLKNKIKFAKGINPQAQDLICKILQLK